MSNSIEQLGPSTVTAAPRIDTWEFFRTLGFTDWQPKSFGPSLHLKHKRLELAAVPDPKNPASIYLWGEIKLPWWRLKEVRHHFPTAAKHDDHIRRLAIAMGKLPVGALPQGNLADAYRQGRAILEAWSEKTGIAVEAIADLRLED